MPPWVWAFDSVKRTNLNGASTMDKVAEVCGCVSILSRGQRDRRLQLFLVGSWNCCFTLQQMLFEPQQLWRHQQIAADTMQRCQAVLFWIPHLFMGFKFKWSKGNRSLFVEWIFYNFEFPRSLKESISLDLIVGSHNLSKENSIYFLNLYNVLVDFIKDTFLKCVLI